MKKNITRILSVLIITLCTVFGAKAQLFQQQFGTTFSTPGSSGNYTSNSTYVSTAASRTNAQFTNMNISSTSMKIYVPGSGDSANTLVANRSGGGNLGLGRDSMQASGNIVPGSYTAPTSLIMRFDYALYSSTGTPSNAVMNVSVGALTSTDRVSTNTNLTARTAAHFGFTWNTTPTFGITKFANNINYGGTYSAKPQSAKKTIFFVLNHTGSAMTYKAPDGTYETVANGKHDVWVGSTRELDDVNDSSATNALSGFHISYGSTTTSLWSIDNLLVDPIPATPASSAASNTGGNSFTANWSTVSGVTGYRLDVATDAAFTSMVSGYNNLYVSGQSTNSYNVTGLSGSTFYYRVRAVSQYTVDEFASGNSGSQTVNLGCTTPTINTQPSTASSAYCANATATALSVSTTGTPTYQWYSNTTASTTGATAISGANSSSYTPSTSATGTLYYYCFISAGSGCTVNSNFSGDITVNASPSPTFISAPSGTVAVNTNQTYTTQSGQSNYVWTFTGTSGVDYNIVSGGTNSDNSVVIAWLTAGSKSVSINYTNGGNCTAASPTSTSVTVAAGVYYNKSNSDITQTSNWGTSTDGTGTNPSDFITAGQTFNLFNTGATMSSAWDVQGAGSKVIIGDGTNALTFAATSAFTATAVDVANAGILQLQTTTIPTFGTLSSGSTVEYAGSSVTQSVTATSYSNLTLSGSGSRTFSGTTNISGTFNPGSGFSAGAGTIVLNGTSTSQTIPAFSYSSLTVSGVDGKSTSGTLAVSGTLTMSNSFTVPIGSNLTLGSAAAMSSTATKVLTVNGTFEIQQNSLTFNAGSGSITVAAGGTFKMSGTVSNNSFAFTNVNFTSGIGAAGSTLYLATAGLPRLNSTTFNGNLTIDVNLSNGTAILLNTTPITVTGNLNVVATNGIVSHATGGSNRSLTVQGGFNMTGGRYDVSAGASSGACALTINGNVNLSGANDTLYTVSSTASGGTGTISILGNLSHTAGVLGRTTAAVPAGTIAFTGSASQDISTIGITNNTNVTLNNSNGARLLTDLSVGSTLTLTSGKIRTNGYSVIMTGSSSSISGATSSNYIAIVDGAGTPVTTGGLTFQSIGTGGRTATVTFPIGTNSSYNPATILSSSSAVAFTARVNNTPYQGTTSDSTVAHTWNIQPASGTPSAAIGLQWNTTDEGVNFNRSSASIAHLNGGVTDVYSSGGSASGSNPWTLNSGSTVFTTYGDFGLIPGVIIPATEPTVQASSASVTTTTSTTATLTWTKGSDATNSLVIIKQGSAVTATPSDAISYSDGSAVYASGTNLGSGNYVVYTGTGNSITVTGLTIGTQYHFAVYSFNGSNGTENVLTTGPATANGSTTIPTYYYVGGAGNASGVYTSTFATANWSTTLGGLPITAFTPTANDVFIFDGSNLGTTASPYTDTVNIAPISSTTTVGKIILTNAAKVKVLTNGSRTINIGNSSFVSNTTALDIPANCYLIFAGSTMTLNLQTNSAANVAGKLVLGIGNNVQLLPAASGSTITFNTGAYCESNQSSSTSAPFGATGNAIVTFASGTTFKSVKGQEPFGGTGASVASFAPGSLCWLNGGSSSNLNLDGRVFGNLQTDFSLSPTGGASGSANSNGFTINNDLTVTAGTLTIAATGSNNFIKGNVNISSGATLRFNPGATATLNFNGTSLQTITNNGTLSVNSTSTTDQSYVINNTAGVVLAGSGTSGIAGLAGTSLTVNNGSNLELASGTLTLQGGTLNLAGTISRTSGNINATATGSTVNITGASSIPASTLRGDSVRNLIINRSSGVSFNGDVKVVTALTLTNGVVNIGNNSMILLTNATVSRASGWIDGTMRKNVATGTNRIVSYEIGDASNYLPVTMKYASVTIAGDVAARTQTPATSYANYSTAPISNINYINRYWTLTNVNTLAFSVSGFGASLNWVAGDVVGTATASSVLFAKYNSGWSKGTASLLSSTSDSLLGVTSLGTIILADDCITLTPSISISSTTTAVCTGSSVTFTATPVNPGTAPTYQWKKNGTTNIGNGSTTLTLQDNEVASNDTITCVMVPNNNCQTSNSVTSNGIGLIVGTVTPSISISTATDTVCSGNSVTFTATGVNPGPGPIYQWKKNGNNLTTGTSITFPANSLVSGDVVTCQLTADNPCQTIATVFSNAITLLVHQSPTSANISSQYSSATAALTMCTVGNAISVYPSIANGVWTSSNASAATVSRDNSVSYSANITAVANGVSSITYTLTTPNTTCITATTIVVTVAQQATPNAITTASGFTSICMNSSDTFKTTSTGGVFSALGRFNINSASGFATATSAGATSVRYTITNASGCSAYSSLNVTVNPLPATPGIAYASGTTNVTGSGGICKNRAFTLVGKPAGGTWSNTGTASGFTIHPTTGAVSTGNVAGTINVSYAVTDANGCSNSRTIASNIVTCATKGVNNTQSTINNEQLTVYPNPARLVINLSVKTLIGKGTIVVTDLYGKQLKQQALSMGINTIDVSGYAKGLYMISVITDAGKQTQKVLLNN